MIEVKECPYCGEEILSVAKKCKHCGEWLNDTVSGSMKSKNSLNKIEKYFRELSIVVTGIAITVGIGFWVNNINSRKDQKQYLEAIVLELKENVRAFDWSAKWLQKPLKYAEYIKSNDKNSLNKDTLSYYSKTDNDGCGYAFTELLSGNFSTNAFEMFKSSGVMRQIKNKELLQDIWRIYAIIETSKSNIDRLFQIKGEEAMKCFQLYHEGKTIDVPMVVFHSCGYAYEMVRFSELTSEAIKKTLLKMEEAGIGK